MKFFEIQLFFSLSILPSISLKRWNFPDNLDFKGKIVAKFLLRSHFLPIYKYMTIKQKSMFKKYVICIMTFFIPFTCVTLCQFHPITSPVLFIKNNKTNYRWEKRKLFVYMTASAYHVISKEVENCIFRHNHIFGHTWMYKKPILTK